MKEKENKKKKEPKRKPKYGMFSCVGYMFKKMWIWEKSIFFSRILIIPLAILVSLWDTYMPSIVIDSLQTSKSFSTVCLTVVILFLGRMVLIAARNYFTMKNNASEHFIVLNMFYDTNVKFYDMDAYLMLDPEVMKTIDRGSEATNRGNHSDGVHFAEYFSNLIINVLSFILFGTIVTTLSPWLLLLIVVGTIIDSLMLKWQKERNFADKDATTLTGRKFGYISQNISGNFSYGKDIRLFNLSEHINLLIKKITGESLNITKRQSNRSLLVSTISLLVILIRDGITYTYLIFEAAKGNINAAEFVLYFSAVSSLSGFMMNIIRQWSNVSRAALNISDYREMFEITGKLNRGQGITADFSAPVKIEFRNVTFKYPDKDENSGTPNKNILENVSFTINPGEKIALVGLNGAGKTTLAKLMCGLLLPTEGDVLINGHSVFEYNRDDLYSFFSLVPQEARILPVSIAENIALCRPGNIDTVRLYDCIRLAGLDEKTASLPSKAFTMLDKRIHTNGIELSGGERQKLLLARALYRNAPMLILDEPTAALDPIAEDKMYKKYKEFTKNCTSLFISHRLSSTRFCDKIFLLDGASFAEEGTHDELMQRGGKYKEMFDIQSKYYREEATENE